TSMDELLGSIAHELRNPIAVISSGLQLLRRAGAVDRCERLVDAMMRQIDVLSRLADDLRDISRLQQGRLELHLQRLDVSESVEAIVGEVGPLLQSRELKLELSVMAGPHLVVADPDRLRQILIHLLDRAFR